MTKSELSQFDNKNPLRINSIMKRQYQTIKQTNETCVYFGFLFQCEKTAE